MKTLCRMRGQGQRARSEVWEEAVMRDFVSASVLSASVWQMSCTLLRKNVEYAVRLGVRFRYPSSRGDQSGVTCRSRQAEPQRRAVDVQVRCETCNAAVFGTASARLHKKWCMAAAVGRPRREGSWPGAGWGARKFSKRLGNARG